MCYFAWQVQYFVMLDDKIVNDVSYATGINHKRHFA